MTEFINQWINSHVFLPIRKWYEGEDVRVDPDEPDYYGGVMALHDKEKKFHWTANLARTLVSFYFEHWKWVWGIAVALFIKFYSCQ